MSKAFANTVVRMAFDKQIFDKKMMAARDKSVRRPRLPIASKTSRRFLTK